MSSISCTLHKQHFVWGYQLYVINLAKSDACLCVFFSGTVAHKIMQKYGFRDGQGLGKHEQGLSTALSVEKTSKRGGKIIIGDSAEKSEIIYTHTRTRTRKHTANMYKPTHHRSKINILLICTMFVFNPMFCHLHNPFECMCMFQHQDPVWMWLIHKVLIQVWLYFISCFPY